MHRPIDARWLFQSTDPGGDWDQELFPCVAHTLQSKRALPDSLRHPNWTICTVWRLFRVLSLA
jgi:hypothetical protein